MRALILVISLIMLLTGALTVNYIYINDVSQRLLDAIDALPPPEDEDCTEALHALIDYWESHIDTVSLSVSYLISDRVSEQALTLSACAASGNRDGYFTALALLRDAVNDMRRLERFSIGNLF